MYKLVKAKNRKEALELSNLRIGQPARVSQVQVTGNLSGDWTVHPEFEVIEEIDPDVNVYLARELPRQAEASVNEA